MDSSDRVYFRVSRGSEAGHLFRVRFDGTSRERLSSHRVIQYVLSAGGERIAAIQKSGECEIIDLQSQERRTLKGSWNFVDWSPTGRYLLLMKSGDASAGSLMIYDLKTELLRTVQGISTIEGEPRWSSRGDEFFFCSRTDDCYTVANTSAEPLLRGASTQKGDFWAQRLSSGDLHINQWDGGFDWIHRVSPTRRFTAIVKGGSLYVKDNEIETEKVLLEETGLFGTTDLGAGGFRNPFWSSDERYILGDIDENMVIVDVLTGRAGVITEGTQPLTWIDNYQLPRDTVVDVDFYWRIKDSGY